MRVAKLGAALLVIVAALTQCLAVAPAAADTGGYPWYDATTLDASQYQWGYSPCPASDPGCQSYAGFTYTLNGTTYGEADPWVYYLRNCTSYVAWKVNQVYGVSVQGWGNAKDWDNSAAAHGYTWYVGSSHTPQVGELAQWEASSSNDYLGHVAYVYAVNSVNGVAIASLDEYNAPAGSGDFSFSNTTAANSESTPDHYIHIGTAPGTWNGIGNATFLGSDQLTPGQVMQGNQYTLSGNVWFALEMQSDGNLVEYSNGRAIWASNTSGNSGAYLSVQTDGNVVIYSSSGTALWATNTAGQSLSRFVVQTDGNLVAYNTGNTAVWASNTGGSPDYSYLGTDRLYTAQTLTSGNYIRSTDKRYALLMQTDGNLAMFGPGYHVLWTANTGGHAGAYLSVQTDGNLVVYSSSNQVLWASNTANQSLSYLTMQTDGNLVAYASSGAVIWASNTANQI